MHRRARSPIFMPYILANNPAFVSRAWQQFAVLHTCPRPGKGGARRESIASGECRGGRGGAGDSP